MYCVYLINIDRNYIGNVLHKKIIRNNFSGQNKSNLYCSLTNYVGCSTEYIFISHLYIIASISAASHTNTKAYTDGKAVAKRRREKECKGERWAFHQLGSTRSVYCR